MLTGSVAASFIYYPTTSVTSNKKAESVVKTFRLNKFSVTVRRTFFLFFSDCGCRKKRRVQPHCFFICRYGSSHIQPFSLEVGFCGILLALKSEKVLKKSARRF